MIRTESPHLTVVAITHPGETGKNNEDRYSVTTYRLEGDRSPVLLAAVADGIGGHQAGEVASKIAVETLVNSLAPFTAGEPVRHLGAAVVEAGRAVSRAAKAASEHEGMGSTLCVAWVIGARLYVASIGDSRIYLLHRHHLQQLTIDHTWVQEAIDHEVIDPSDARHHPHAHILRRHLGGRQDPKPDLRLRLSPGETDPQSEANQGLLLEPGDQILLCTDGLTDLVEEGEIAEALQRQAPKDAVQALVALARARGGFDNITAVLLEVPAPGEAEKQESRRRIARWTRLILAAMAGATLLTALAVAALAAAWWFGFGPWFRPTPTSVQTPVLTVVPSFFEVPSKSATQASTPTSTQVIPVTATLSVKETSTPSALPTSTPTP